jgi:hypothetical protein
MAAINGKDFSETAIKRIEADLLDALEWIGFDAEIFDDDDIRELALVAILTVTMECGCCDPGLYSND